MARDLQRPPGLIRAQPPQGAAETDNSTTIRHLCATMLTHGVVVMQGQAFRTGPLDSSMCASRYVCRSCLAAVFRVYLTQLQQCRLAPRHAIEGSFAMIQPFTLSRCMLPMQSAPRLLQPACTSGEPKGVSGGLDPPHAEVRVLQHLPTSP
jgi:hypothetical protein